MNIHVRFEIYHQKKVQKSPFPRNKWEKILKNHDRFQTIHEKYSLQFPKK